MYIITNKHLDWLWRIAKIEKNMYNPCNIKMDKITNNFILQTNNKKILDRNAKMYIITSS